MAELKPRVGLFRKPSYHCSRPGECSASICLDAFVGLAVAATTLAVGSDNPDYRLVLALAMWAGLIVGLVARVLRLFETRTLQSMALVTYGLVTTTVLGALVVAIPVGTELGASAGWITVASSPVAALAAMIVAWMLLGVGWWPDDDQNNDEERIALKVIERSCDELRPRAQAGIFSRLLRRVLDVTGASVLLVVTAPLMATIALAVKLEGHGPVLFHQTRVGLAGQVFQLRKFRTMMIDAEADGTPRWAQVDDPRVTRVGRLLRRWRLDELPQLFHVLAGRMSLVGPRPERPEFVEHLRDQLPGYDLRHLVKPGLTGWAQVRYTYASSVEEAARKLEFDVFYIANRSIVFDLKILADTVPAVLRGGGPH